MTTLDKDDFEGGTPIVTIQLPEGTTPEKAQVVLEEVRKRCEDLCAQHNAKIELILPELASEEFAVKANFDGVIEPD